MAIIHEDCGGIIKENTCHKCGQTGKLEEFGQGEEIHARLLSPEDQIEASENDRVRQEILTDIKEEAS